MMNRKHSPAATAGTAKIEIDEDADGRELKAISAWLDEHPQLLGLVAADLRRHSVEQTGRHGLPAEAVAAS